MRAAPPIEVILGSGRREAAVLAAVWLAAVASTAAWLAARSDWPLAARCVAGLAMAVGGAIAWGASRPMRGRLAWDGGQWRWRASGGSDVAVAPGLRIAIDGGGWVLLRDDRGRWCVLARHQAGALWHGLRMALHAGRPTARPGATP